MSEDANTDGSEAEEALDASFKVDSSSLGEDETGFAAALGFGDDGASPPDAAEAAEQVASDTRADDAEVERGQPESDPPSEAELAAADAEAADDAGSAEAAADPADTVDASEQDEADGAEDVPEDADEPSAVQAEGVEEDDDGALADTEANDADLAPDASEEPTESGDWEEIHPRPAAEGIQETLSARADDVMSRGAIEVEVAHSPVAHGPSAPAAEHRATIEALESTIDESQQALTAATARLADQESEIATLRASMESDQAGSAEEEKELFELRVEMESIAIERDQLIDQLAATSGLLVQAQRGNEKLEASLRAARGALIPLPEGERALRSEVIGLRGRLDEASQENVRLSSEVASVATELAIASARVEDRQHEIDFHSERADALENGAREKDQQLAEAVARHREALSLATRLQAENSELRSAQAALEETLEARDLEITAREEHLRVTRDGLALRDGEIIDLKERLDQARHQHEAFEAELERGQLERRVLEEKVDSRASRIATLTETLSRIGEAMGQRIEIPDAPSALLSQSAWAKRNPLPAPTPPTASATAPLSPATETPPVAPAPRPPEISPEPVESAVAAAEAHAEPPPPTTRTTTTSTIAEEEESAEASDPEFDAPVPREVLPVDVEEPAGDDGGAPDVTEELPVGSSVLCPSPPLPPMLSVWRDARMAEIAEDEATSVADFLADRLKEHLGDPGPDAIFLRSLGGSLPDAEVRLVKALSDRGVEGVRFEVLDVDEAAADARRHRIELAGMGEVIDVQVGDLEDWNPDAPCHGILLSDALHAQHETHQIFDHLAPAIARGALLLFVGRIGSGPVQLSASTLMRLEELWQILPESLRQADGLGQAPFRGDDGGSPPPAIDAAQALLERFEPIALAGFGHLADLVIGPTRGFALSEEDENAVRLLESVVAIDESRAETESLTPRHGVGVFAHDSASPSEKFGRAWPTGDDSDA